MGKILSHPITWAALGVLVGAKFHTQVAGVPVVGKFTT